MEPVFEQVGHVTKPNTQPTTPDAPIVEPNALADSVTVKAGIVAVRQWMAELKLK